MTLSKEQEAQLDAMIRAGKFESAEQFIDYSLALVEEDAETTAWLRTKVGKGLASLDKGESSSLSTEEIVAEAKRRHAA